MNADGTDQRFLVQMRFPEYPEYPEWNHNPSWSPDGSKIAVEGHGRIWVVNADGTAQRLLLDRINSYPSVMYGSPAWTPDGSQLVFNRYGSTTDVCRINLDGSGFTRIASAGLAPIFGVDTSSLIVSARYNNNNEIMRLSQYFYFSYDYYDIDWGRSLTRNAGNDIEPSWGPSFNSAPVAIGENFSLLPSEAKTLHLPAPGVLKNDTDADGDALQAVLTSAPDDARVELRGDGSLSFTPHNWRSETYTVTYVVTDGKAYSNPVTVNITVKPRDDKELR